MKRQPGSNGAPKRTRGKPAKRSTLKMLLRNLAGLTLIIIGLALWLLPILPGAILILPGFLLLDFPGKRLLIRRLEQSKLMQRVLRNRQLARLWRIGRRRRFKN